MHQPGTGDATVAWGSPSRSVGTCHESAERGGDGHVHQPGTVDAHAATSPSRSVVEPRPYRRLVAFWLRNTPHYWDRHV
jgi:hypothetical protein